MKATLNALHHQSTDWNRELDFYIDELALLTNRVQEAISANNDATTTSKAAGFEKKFIEVRKNIDALRTDIKYREEKVEAVAKESPGHIDDPIRMNNDKIFERMVSLANNIATLRYEFNQFLIKLM